jgi:DNA-binding XRE family transcriptional regulator
VGAGRHRPPLCDARPPNAKVVLIDGSLLRQMRRARGLSREVLAWTAGLGITTLARLEGEPWPHCRYQTLERLAAVLGENPRAMTPDRLSNGRK